MGLSGDNPRYNEWIVVRRIVVAGFAADPDWRVSQDAQLPDANGLQTRATQVPNLPGRPAGGFAVMMVGVTATGKPVAPAVGVISVDVLELVQFSGQFDDHAPHISAVEDPATPLSALSMALPANFSARVDGAGGAQSQYAFRVSALTPPAGAIEVRLLVKPVGGS